MTRISAASRPVPRSHRWRALHPMARCILGSAIVLLMACNDASGPNTATYGVRLAGVTTDHGAAMVVLRNLPPNTPLTAGAGVLLHQRPLPDGSSIAVFLAGDLTRIPLLTYSVPRTPAMTGTVTELARQDGSLVTGPLPTLTIRIQ